MVEVCCMTLTAYRHTDNGDNDDDYGDDGKDDGQNINDDHHNINEDDECDANEDNNL